MSAAVAAISPAAVRCWPVLAQSRTGQLESVRPSTVKNRQDPIHREIERFQRQLDRDPSIPAEAIAQLRFPGDHAGYSRASDKCRKQPEGLIFPGFPKASGNQSGRLLTGWAGVPTSSPAPLLSIPACSTAWNHGTALPGPRARLSPNAGGHGQSGRVKAAYQ